MNTAKTRLETAVSNIMSGDNNCGTLANAALNGDSDYFRDKIRPVVAVYEQEAEDLRQQRDAANRDVELKRFALESILSNMDIPAGPVKDAVARAMPGHPLLN
jgi:hypothetical protein